MILHSRYMAGQNSEGTITLYKVNEAEILWAWMRKPHDIIESSVLTGLAEGVKRHVDAGWTISPCRLAYQETVLFKTRGHWRSLTHARSQPLPSDDGTLILLELCDKLTTDGRLLKTEVATGEQYPLVDSDNRNHQCIC